MKLFYSALIIFIAVTNLYSLPIDTLNFGNYFIGASPKLVFNKYSDTNNFKIVSVKLSNNLKAVAYDVGETLSLGFELNPINNLDFSGYAFINVIDKFNNCFSFPIFIKAEPHYNDSYDLITYNKKDTQLINALRADMNSKYVSFTYKVAREKMFGSIDNYNGFVECIYTGRKLETSTIPDVNTTHFNTEHTWAQVYGAKTEPEKSDLFHLRPTYEAPNSARASYPFGNVTDLVLYSDSGSTKGTNAKGDTIFEPRDKVKGDIARGMFYFALRYGNKSNVEMDFLEKQYTELYQWNSLDTVDQTEMERNSGIEQHQMIRNPFIDHPEFIDRFNLIGTYTENSNIARADSILKFSFIGSLNTYFFSNISTKLAYAEITGSGAAKFKVEIGDSIMPANSIYFIPVTNYYSDDISSAILKVKFVDSEEFVIMLSSAIPSSVDESVNNSVISIYPNPVTGNKLNIRINKKEFTNSAYQLTIYDINAKVIYNSQSILDSNIITVPINMINNNGREFLIAIKINGNTYTEKFIIK